MRLSSYAHSLDLAQERILDDILETNIPAAFLQSSEDAFNTTLMFRFNLNQNDIDAWFIIGPTRHDLELKKISGKSFKMVFNDLKTFKKTKITPS